MASFIYWREITQKGKDVRIPKIRTLIPGSTSTSNTSLTPHGKYQHNEDDFISPVHGWMRRYWIDELPQLYSLIKGDLKLIGIRAKEPKINLCYSTNFRHRLENELKHGIIDITYSLQKQIDLSQPRKVEALYRLYLQKYSKRPFISDLEFLCGFGRNVIKGRRSE